MVAIRPAASGDAEAIAGLARQLGHSATDAARVAANLARLTAEREGIALVGVAADGAVCGFARGVVEHFVVDAPFAELAALVVADTARSQGVGKALLAAVERWARAGGFERLVVRSNVIRTRAHRFYLREGYAEAKRQAVFVKDLAPTATAT